MWEVVALYSSHVRHLAFHFISRWILCQSLQLLHGPSMAELCLLWVCTLVPSTRLGSWICQWSLSDCPAFSFTHSAVDIWAFFLCHEHRKFILATEPFCLWFPPLGISLDQMSPWTAVCHFGLSSNGTPSLKRSLTPKSKQPPASSASLTLGCHPGFCLSSYLHLQFSRSFIWWCVYDLSSPPDTISLRIGTFSVLPCN